MSGVVTGAGAVLAWPLKELGHEVVSRHLDGALITSVNLAEVGMAVAITKPAGSSLADRFCIVIARRLECVALTSDRAWMRVAADLGVTGELIR